MHFSCSKCMYKGLKAENTSGRGEQPRAVFVCLLKVFTVLKVSAGVHSLFFKNGFKLGMESRQTQLSYSLACN